MCRELQGLVYRLALRMLGRVPDAEDATQEILLQRIEEHPADVAELIDAIDRGLLGTRPDSSPDGEARLLARDVQRTCTQQMLRCLSREQRVAVLLVDLLGASDADAASICGVSAETFRRRLSRGRALLRPILEQRCGLYDPALPCRCVRPAAAKQAAGVTLPVYRDAAEPDWYDRARDQLGKVTRVGAVFAVSPPPAPKADIWRALEESFPDLLR